MKIVHCNVADLLVLRRDVMRPGMDISNVMYSGDNDVSAIHLGIMNHL